MATLNTYSDHVTILDDKALRLGDGFDFKALWNSGTSRINITDSGDTLRWTFDPATGDLVQVTGASTINFEAMSITGVQDGDASMTFSADEGDDNADTWRIRAAAATNAFEIRNFATGSYVTAIGIASATNDVTLAGGLTVDGGTLSVTNGLITTAVTSLVLSSTAAGNAFISFDPKPSNGTSDARVRLFRLTNTTGNRQVDIFKGDGSATTTIAFNAATGDATFTGDLAVTGKIGIDGTPPNGIDLYIPTGSIALGQNEFYGTNAYFDSGFKFAEDGPNYGGYLLFSGAGGGKIVTSGNSGNAGDILTQVAVLEWTAAGVVTIGNDLIVSGTAIHFAEGSAPTPIGSSGAWYTTSSNQIVFQDGAGVSHLMGPPAFSDLGFHVVPANAVALTVNNQDEWTKITVFNSLDGHVGIEDSGGNVVGSKANSEFTVGTDGAGSFRTYLTASLASAVASKAFWLGVAHVRATPITITNFTGVDPTVVTTSGAHGLEQGDSITISGSDGTAIDGDFMIRAGASPSATTFEMDDFAGATIDGGAGGSTGSIDVCIHASSIVHRVTNSTSVGSFSAIGDVHDVAASDTIYAVLLNRTDANNADFEACSLQVERIRD